MVTLEQAKQLRRGDVLTRSANGKVYNWRVNGQVKLWKRDASRVSVPLKHGLYDYFTLTEHDLHSFDPPMQLAYDNRPKLALDNRPEMALDNPPEMALSLVEDSPEEMGWVGRDGQP